jgi:hypothetical protein
MIVQQPTKWLESMRRDEGRLSDADDGKGGGFIEPARQN